MNRSDIILYFDCLSGISGDMTVGAFLGLGISIDYLTEELKKLGLEGYSISFSQVKRHSLLANKFKVEVNPSQPIRGYGDIVKLISESSLRENVKDISLKIFEEIAKAEAIVHCQDIDDVHFHEVGAVDTIVDVVSTAICIDKINPDTIVSSPIPLGRGNTKTHHGTIPVPAPATLEILKGLPVYGGDFDFEVTTPTGAAIVKTLVKDFCAMPLMEVEKIGVGAGDVDTKEVPNLL
ncbi:MAG: LarC family nickel insertion protein, partial [Actinobacteria bacterium]|nr:LarC family nickel insertion protein [Actinomycetota bacterium]